jgi:hypothetical protein
MPARFGDRLQHMLAQLIGKRFEISARQLAQVGWRIDGGEQAWLIHDRK